MLNTRLQRNPRSHEAKFFIHSLPTVGLHYQLPPYLRSSEGFWRQICLSGGSEIVLSSTNRSGVAWRLELVIVEGFLVLCCREV